MAYSSFVGQDGDIVDPMLKPPAELCTFIASPLGRSILLTLRFGLLTPGRVSGTHGIGGWVGSGAGLNIIVTFLPLLGREPRSSSL
jgi:hypothetical protein